MCFGFGAFNSVSFRSSAECNKKFIKKLSEISFKARSERHEAQALVRDVDAINELCMQQLVSSFRLCSSLGGVRSPIYSTLFFTQFHFHDCFYYCRSSLSDIVGSAAKWLAASEISLLFSLSSPALQLKALYIHNKCSLLLEQNANTRNTCYLVM